ncbi:MAG: O-methyltransferase [Mycobacterium sp.]|jgi:SAM-dependent methyltransferase|nr:O-methyltransferase [Mycobacterium sp.]
MSVSMQARTLARRLVYQTPLKSLLAVRFRYPYMHSPTQLRVLLDAVDDALKVDGALVEVGCAWGTTTVFLNEHLRTSENGNRRYFALDTFGGFVDRDVDFEVENRSKKTEMRQFEETFRNNSVEAVQATIDFNGYQNVTLVEADVVAHDFSDVGPIAFALIDVDLFLPVDAALEKVWQQLSPGGVIVVDDCAPNNEWDGALEAYEKFVERVGLQSDIRAVKLGIIHKPE